MKKNQISFEIKKTEVKNDFDFERNDHSIDQNSEWKNIRLVLRKTNRCRRWSMANFYESHLRLDHSNRLYRKERKEQAQA